MASAFRYEVVFERRAIRFVNRHPELTDRFIEISDYLAQRPHSGPRITHLKGRFQCCRRWREGDYRPLYDIIEDGLLVTVFDADNRGQIYR